MSKPNLKIVSNLEDRKRPINWVLLHTAFIMPGVLNGVKTISKATAPHIDIWLEGDFLYFKNNANGKVGGTHCTNVQAFMENYE